MRTDLFREGAPPPGLPVVERYVGVAWPGGRFQNLGELATGGRRLD